MMPFYTNRFNDFPFCQIWEGRQLAARFWELLLWIFSRSEFYLFLYNSQSVMGIIMNLVINFSDCTCIISRRDVPLLGDSPLLGGRADIMVTRVMCDVFTDCHCWPLMVHMGPEEISHWSSIKSLFLGSHHYHQSVVVCQRKLSSDLKWELFWLSTI